MSAGTAAMTDSSLTESVSQGVIEYQYQEMWQVVTTSSTDGPATVLGASGLPTPLSSKVVPSTGTTVWVTSRNPKRRGTRAERLVWDVAVNYTNLTSRFERDERGNPVDDPLQVVPRIRFENQETWKPITKAYFRQLTDADGNFAANPKDFNSEKAFAGIVNSARDVIPRERRDAESIITISKYVEQWNNAWDDNLFRTNDSAVTIRQSDNFGTRRSKTYQTGSLLFVNASSEDVWRNGRLYLDVTFTLLHNAGPFGWEHGEPDMGTRTRVYVGQYKADGTTYTSDDVALYESAEFFDADGLVPHHTSTESGERIYTTEPFHLNGNGMPAGIKNASGQATTNKTFVTWFRIYEKCSFTALKIV